MPPPTNDRGRPSPQTAPDPDELMFGRLLALFRGDIRNAQQRAVLEEKVRCEPLWRTHWESIRLLHLESAAAMQDGKDLQNFPIKAEPPFCRTVAADDGRAFLPLLRGEERSGRWSREEWAQHALGCVYCRRMWRRTHARFETEALAVKIEGLRGKVLLRDWLLAPYYQEALAAVTRRLQGTPPAPVAATTGMEIHDEGPTELVRRDPGLFLEQIEPVARRLLQRVLHSEAFLDRFLEYLRRNDVLTLLRGTGHVRDKMGQVLAEFCRHEGRSDADAVGAAVTREVMKLVLWQVALDLQRAAREGERERATLDAVAEEMESALATPGQEAHVEDIFDRALVRATADNRRRAVDLKTLVRAGVARLSE